MTLKKKLLVALIITFTVWFFLLSLLTLYGLDHFFSSGKVLTNLPKGVTVYYTPHTTTSGNKNNLEAATLVRTNLEKTTNDFWFFYILLSTFFVLGGLFFIYNIVGKGLEPLKELGNEISSVNSTTFELQGGYSSKKKPPEINSLEVAFNILLKRLQKSFEKQGRFINNAAHELKTPLAIIKISQQLLNSNEKNSIADYMETLKIIETNSEKMEVILDNLLLLAKGNQIINKQLISIKSYLKIIIKDLIVIYPNCNINILFDDIYQVNVEKNMFENIIKNLLMNSIKYGSNCVNIYCKVREDIEIVIEDNGIGIPKNKLPFVKEPFYRCDDSRSKKREGFGLGLAIVDEIMVSHNGSLFLESTEGKGTRVTLSFPSSETTL